MALLFKHKDITLITNDGFVSSKNRYLFVKLGIVVRKIESQSPFYLFNH